MTRLRIVSLNARRTLYSYALPTPSHFDGLPPSPSPSPSPVLARHPVATSRLTTESQHNQQQNTHHSPHSPLALALTQTTNAQPLTSPPLALSPAFSFYHPSIALKHSQHSHSPEGSHAPFQFLSAAHGIPKCRPHRPMPSTDNHDVDLAVQVGEDSYFLRNDALGVSDGVGGFTKSNYRNANSALFARRLMHFCSDELAHPSTEATAPDPIQVLQISYERCIEAAKADGIVGGSTALLALIQGNTVRIAHLGDCCIILIRDDAIMYRSTEMQHSFNYPYQLGPLSQSIPERDAQSITLSIQENDILILSTDGMSDNLWDEDILEEVVRVTSWARQSSENAKLAANASKSPPASPLTWNWSKRTLSTSAQSSALFLNSHPIPPSPSATLLPSTLSQTLCSRAKRVSSSVANPPQHVPFGQRAHQEGIPFTGGKTDDITVVVAMIQTHPP